MGNEALACGVQVPPRGVVTHLDLLPCDGLQLGLLPHGELVDQHLVARRHGDLEGVSILDDLGDALDVLALLDQVVREAWEIGG